MDRCKQKIQESNHSGTMSEMSTKKEAESKDKMKKILTPKHVLCHCRTKYDVKETTFVWSIANFWDIYNTFDTLTSSEVERLFFKIDMCIDRNNLKLIFCIRDLKDQIKDKINRCNIYIQGSKGEILHNCEILKFCLNDVLYEISIETFHQNESIYLLNDTLSICFTFKSYEKILHTTLMTCTSKPIIIPEITNNNPKNSKNYFTSDDPLQTSDVFVTFLIERKYLHVKRKLCANIPYLDDVLKYEFDKEKDKLMVIPIQTVTYDIFQLIILYLETDGLIDLKLHADDSNYMNKLHYLLRAADLYKINNLKLFCEERLIEYTRKENVLLHLDIAINYNARSLESFTKKFIKLHLDDILNTTEFQELIRNNSKILLSDILKQKLHEDVLNIKSNSCNVCQISPKN